MINSKRGVMNLLTEDIIDIALDIVVIGILFLFLSTRAGDAAAYQEIYAKQIALLLDSAKPGMIIHFNMEKGIELAKKELGKDANLNNIVRINGNVVTVQLNKEAGYSYSFFNNIGVDNSYIDTTNNKEFVFLTGKGTELQATSTIYDLINYAKNNPVVTRKCNCGQNCEDYAKYISETSSNYGIDPILLLSLMMQESECTSRAFSGSSVGLMQINLIHCGEYGLPSDKETCKTELINNIPVNIDVGARILMASYNAYKGGKIFQGCSNRNILYSGWEAAIRGYNGWGCGVDSQRNKFYAQDHYVEDVINRYNELGGK